MANTGSFKDVIALSDGANAKFAKAVQTSEKKILSEVVTMLKDLEITKAGNIATTPANLKKMMTIRTKLYKLANNKEYLAALKDLIGTFDEIYKKQVGVLALKDKIGRGEERYKLTKEIAVENTIQALSGDGLAANVTGKLNEMLLTAVTTGAKFSDLQGQLYEYLADTEKSEGALTRYAKTWSVTALSQYTGQINKLATDDLGFEWFEYVGSNIETTREFCQHVTRKRYIHKSELADLLKGHIVDYLHGEEHDCAIYEKTKLPLGMIEGTTEENLQVNCGGWNCRHQLFPIAEEAVPQAIRDAMKQKDMPSNEQQALIDHANALIAERPKYPCADDMDFDDVKDALAASPIDFNSLEYNVKCLEVSMQNEEKSYANAEAKAQKALNNCAKLKADNGLIIDTSDVVSEMNNGVYDWKTLEKKAAELMKTSNALMWDYFGKKADAEALVSKIAGMKSAEKVDTTIPKTASIQELEQIIQKLKNFEDLLKSHTHVPDIMETAKDLSLSDLQTLDDIISIMDENLAFASTCEEKEKLLKEALDYAKTDPQFGKYIEKWVKGKQAELDAEKVANETSKKIAEIQAYSDAHPKSGKIKSLLDEAKLAASKGDYDMAKAKVEQAKKVIDVNEASTKSKQAKAASANVAKMLEAAKAKYAGQIADIVQYSASHPKSGKVADLLQKITDYIDAADINNVDGVQDLINKANDIIAKNEASTASKAAKKGGTGANTQPASMGSAESVLALVKDLKIDTTALQKAITVGNKSAADAEAKKVMDEYELIKNLPYLDNPLEDAKQFTYQELLSVSNAVNTFVNTHKKDKGTYHVEADWVYNHKKYITWNVAYKAYKKLEAEAAEVEKVAQFSSDAAKLLSYPDPSPKLVKLKAQITDAIGKSEIEKAKKLLAEAEKEIKRIENEKLKELMKNLGKSENEVEEYCDKHRTFTSWSEKGNQQEFRNMRDEHVKYTYEAWKDASMESRDAVIDYGDGSYGWVNKSYWRDKVGCEDGRRISEFLDKCISTGDLVLRRGCGFDEVSSIFGDAFGKAVVEAVQNGDFTKVNAMAGLRGLNEGFISTSFDMQGGFHRSVEFIFYAPKGTQMCYALPFVPCGESRGRNWDGKSSDTYYPGSENEVIVNRGYTYRFIKAQAGGHDCARVTLFCDLTVRTNRTVI